MAFAGGTAGTRPPASPRRAAEARLSLRRTRAARPSEAPLVWTAAAVLIGAITAPALATIGWRPEAMCLVALALLIAWRWAERLRSSACPTVLLLAAISAAGAGWSASDWRLFPENDLGRFATDNSEPVAIEGVISKGPRYLPAKPASAFRAIPSTDRTILVVQATRLRDGDTWIDADGKCEVTIAGELTEVEPGAIVRIYGQLRRPRPALNPGERDMAAVDRAAGRLAIVWCEAKQCVQRLNPSGSSTWFAKKVTHVRNAALGLAEQRTTEVASPLIKAMLLGESSHVSQETFEAFRKTGTVHLLVVSGLHVGLIASLLPTLAAFGLLPRRLAWLTTLLLVAGYVVLVGAEPPAVRAGFVVAAVGVASLLGRKVISANTLAGAALAVFAAAPNSWTSTGTQLSFLAAATLVGVTAYGSYRRSRERTPIERLIRSARSPQQQAWHQLVGWVGWCLGASAAVQVITGPLVACEFHLISPAAGPLSLIAAPILWGLLVSGFAMLVLGLLGAIGIPLGWATAGLGTLASLAAEGLGWVVGIAAKIPGSSLWVAGPAPWWVAAWCLGAAFAAAVLVYAPKRRSWVLRMAVTLIACAFVPTLYNATTKPKELRCTFIAVGHGSSTLIETPNGGTVLVDAGALAAPERVADTIARTLWARGIQRIDALVITHADSDHFNAVPGLMQRFPIDVVLTTTLTFPSWNDPNDRSGPAELQRRLAKAEIPVRTVEAGDRWNVDGVGFEVLHPDDIGVVDSDNANSLVLGLDYQGKVVLLPGDLEGAGLELLVSQAPYHCDVLLAPHHGSQRSDPAGFAAWCQPKEVIISSGAPRTQSGDTYASRNARVWNTHQSGAVTASMGQGSVEITTNRGSRAWR